MQLYRECWTIAVFLKLAGHGTVVGHEIDANVGRGGGRSVQVMSRNHGLERSTLKMMPHDALNSKRPKCKT